MPKGKEKYKYRRRWWNLQGWVERNLGRNWNKIVYGTATLFIILGIMAEPVAGAVSAVPIVGPSVAPIFKPVSEVFTPEVTSVRSFTMIVSENITTTEPASNQTVEIGGLNVTEYFPAHQVTKTLYNWVIGEGQFTLTGKGSLSQDTPLILDVTFFIPGNMIWNFSEAYVTFHPFGARIVPLQTDILGAPVYANLTLSPTGRILVPGLPTYFGIAIGEKWDSGPQTVEWLDSGPFNIQTAFHNVLLKQADNMTRLTSSETPQISNLIQIDSAQVGATVRTNELATTLSFFILALTLVSLRRVAHTEVKEGEEPEGNDNQYDRSPE